MDTPSQSDKSEQSSQSLHIMLCIKIQLLSSINWLVGLQNRGGGAQVETEDL